jgi:hypothetical protein
MVGLMKAGIYDPVNLPVRPRQLDGLLMPPSTIDEAPDMAQLKDPELETEGAFKGSRRIHTAVTTRVIPRQPLCRGCSPRWPAITDRSHSQVSSTPPANDTRYLGEWIPAGHVLPSGTRAGVLWCPAVSYFFSSRHMPKSRNWCLAMSTRVRVCPQPWEAVVVDIHSSHAFS